MSLFILVCQFYAILELATFVTDVASWMCNMLLQELHFLSGSYLLNPVKHSNNECTYHLL
jgi:hypothetical protein